MFTGTVRCESIIAVDLIKHVSVVSQFKIQNILIGISSNRWKPQFLQ